MVYDMMSTDEQYRKFARVACGNAPYYRFTLSLYKRRGFEVKEQKTWLLHHGLIETWDMIDNE